MEELTYRIVDDRTVEIFSDTPLTILLDNIPVKSINRYHMKLKYNRGDTDSTIFQIMEHNQAYRALCND